MHSGGGGSYRAVERKPYRWMDGWTGNKANHFINIVTQEKK